MRPRSEGFAFAVVAREAKARAAVLTTPHGDVATPTFMPVGTQGNVKGLSPAEVASTGARSVLGNTYHLWLRPGADLIAKLGGLHTFSAWPHAMLTDSGGFQAFSLGAGASRGKPLVVVDEEGITFRSHLDGTSYRLTPEEAVRVQALLGADIQMQLDICPPGDSDVRTVEEAVSRTTRWAVRALAAPRPPAQALFGIVQGGCHANLRKRHIEELSGLDPGFDGVALGGFSVGEPIAQMTETLHEVASYMDRERPRYLMGVGTPRDLLEGIEAGIDMFDCVMPTRNARNGQAFTRFGRIVIKQAKYKDDSRPIDERCACACCQGGFSRAYLRHLYMAREMTALRLLSLHNLHFYGELVGAARASIVENRFASFLREARAETIDAD